MKNSRKGQWSWRHPNVSNKAVSGDILALLSQKARHLVFEPDNFLHFKLCQVTYKPNQGQGERFAWYVGRLWIIGQEDCSKQCTLHWKHPGTCRAICSGQILPPFSSCKLTFELSSTLSGHSSPCMESHDRKSLLSSFKMLDCAFGESNDQGAWIAMSDWPSEMLASHIWDQL